MLKYKIIKGGGTLKTNSFVLVKEKPNTVEFSDGKEVFGEVEEITSRAVAAERANVAKITLWGADVLHHHKKAEETYICLEGEGEIYLDGQIFEVEYGELGKERGKEK